MCDRFLKTIFFFILAFLPLSAMAGVFDVPATDKSMQYLGMVFGTVGSLPIQSPVNANSGGGGLFGQLIYLFNQIVFALALLIIIFTSIIGTINTAQEGEVMGKKMSSIWIPVRAGIGMYLLLPSSTAGYNWIQIAVMWMIVQGVGAANALWKQVIISNQNQGSLVADTRQADLQSALPTVTGLFAGQYCMAKINAMTAADPVLAKSLGNDFIVAKTVGSTVFFGRESIPTDALCGSMDVPNVTNGTILSTNTNVAENQGIMANAIMLAASSLQESANELVQNPTGPWSGANAWVEAARVLQGAVMNLQVSSQNLDQLHQQAIFDGWIHAGSYYFQLVAGGRYTPITMNYPVTPPNPAVISQAIGATAANQLVASINAQTDSVNTTSYTYYVLNNSQMQVVSPANRAGGSLSPISTGGGKAGELMSQLFGNFFNNMISSLTQQMTTGCLSSSTNPNAQQGDPVTCMARFGATISTVTEALFWSFIPIVFVLWMATTGLFCENPLGPAMNFFSTTLIPMVFFLVALLWGAGITLALYIPFIPFLVFTFAALGWLVLVIEAMLGAPLIALTLIIPSEDEIGKAGHAIVILLGLFLRPGLMILGFVFGMQLLSVAIAMLNFGFAGTMQMSLNSMLYTNIFAVIAIIVLYAGVATSIVHESFSLIYVLPDKVLRWLGVAGEGSEAGQHAKEMEGAVGKGTGIAGGMMKGSMSAASSNLQAKGGGGGKDKKIGA